MSYEVGQHIDLSYLNKRAPAADSKKKTFSEAVEHLVEVGTSFDLRTGKAARRIPVVFA